MNVFDKIKGGLIVSCQALETEPLYSSKIMARMAFAAKEGGAVGIRANTTEDIIAIKKEVDLPGKMFLWCFHPVFFGLLHPMQ